MQQKEINEILQKKDSSAAKEAGAESFGLKGTIERIRYFCGNEDIVSIESEYGEYTQIEFKIAIGRYNTEGKNVQGDAY